MHDGTSRARTLSDKIWDKHEILSRDGQSLMFIDRHFIHEGSRRAFEILAEKGLRVFQSDRTFAAPDHYVPTATRDLSLFDPERRAMLDLLVRNTSSTGIRMFGIDDEGHGILHVIGPEQGLTQPGMFIACGDSHTSTHGALGAFALGVGASDVAHVLATQTLWLVRPRTLRITVDGETGPGVTAKDVILSIIAHIGTAGATGHAVEYAGSFIRGLSMEGRLTICNMTIEAGGRSGMVAPDETTFAYLDGRPYAPKGVEWDAAIASWSDLASDDGASFDRDVHLRAENFAPMVTWGTSPEEAVPITGAVPMTGREGMAASLAYMDLRPGTEMEGLAIQNVFIGSCTNGRIEDLRFAANVLGGHKVANGVRAIIVPGSRRVKEQAEAEGLDRVFRETGAEWREAGCSMCLGSNGDQVPAGERCASTSNRNFAGRQGAGARTHLVSPAMAAAAAVTGCLTDVRKLMRRA